VSSKVFLILGAFLLNSAMAFAGTGMSDLTDSSQNVIRKPATSREIFDNIKQNYEKSVLLIMSSEDSTGQTREAQINQIIANAKDHIQFCFEKALSSKEQAFSSDNVFYFTVNSEGQFDDISSEANHDDSLNKNFHVCIYQMLSNLRAAPASEKFAFRFKVSVKAPLRK
jgi:hypothetical protein